MVDIKDMIEENIEEGLEDIEEIVEGKAKKKTSKKKTEKKDDKELEIEAEAESTDENKVKDLEKKKKALLEKVAKMKKKISEDVPSIEEMKEQVKTKKKDMLIPLEEYVKSGIYIGTKVVTPAMRQFVYRRRADGLAIFNTDLIDEKIREGVEYLSQFEPKDVILVCKRPSGWDAVKMFAEFTGVRIFTKKYPAGILTNTDLPNFTENELTIVTDSWLDKNAMRDTKIVRKKVMMICDTNNFPKDADKIIIGNNKSQRSLGVIFYLLTIGYMKSLGKDTSKVPDLEYWTGEKTSGKKQ